LVAAKLRCVFVLLIVKILFSREEFLYFSFVSLGFPSCSFVVEMLVFLCGLRVRSLPSSGAKGGERVLVVALLRCVSVVGFGF
jgi:hypothetical protein